MKRSTKAALFSGLLFPGLGHIYLRRYIVGLVLICLCAWGVYTIASVVLEAALNVVGELESSGKVIDAATINQQLAKQDLPSTDLAILVIIVTWLIGIIDSYRVGRVLDQQTEKPEVAEGTG